MRASAAELSIRPWIERVLSLVSSSFRAQQLLQRHPFWLCDACHVSLCEVSIGIPYTPSVVSET